MRSSPACPAAPIANASANGSSSSSRNSSTPSARSGSWSARPVRAAVAYHQLHQRADVPGEGAASSGPARCGTGQSGLHSGLQTARRRTAHPRDLAGGFPSFSHAELALFLAELPISYRYSIRAIPLGLRASVGQLGVHRRNWFQKRKGARAMLSESIGSGTGAAFENQHALRMAADADDAIAEAESGEVRFCYVTPRSSSPPIAPPRPMKRRG